MMRTGKTTRMLEYAIGAARQGREIAIICYSDEHRKWLYKHLLKLAEDAGCKWVVGDGTNGGHAGNIELYHLSQAMVAEAAPGDYQMRGLGRDGSREVLVDNAVYEARYKAVLDNYLRWI